VPVGNFVIREGLILKNDASGQKVGESFML
jgi:hypothetical protein